MAAVLTVLRAGWGGTSRLRQDPLHRLRRAAFPGGRPLRLAHPLGVLPAVAERQALEGHARRPGSAPSAAASSGGTSATLGTSSNSTVMVISSPSPTIRSSRCALRRPIQPGAAVAGDGGAERLVPGTVTSTGARARPNTSTGVEGHLHRVARAVVGLHSTVAVNVREVMPITEPLR